MTQINLQQARALELPTREEMLRRDISVQQFWDQNRPLLEKAWAEWEVAEKDNLLTLDDSLLDPRLRKAVHEAWEDPSKELAVADLWEEVSAGVFKAQFFDPARLAEFRHYLEKVAGSGIPARPPYGIALNRNGVMVDPRSEGYLAAPNFQVFYRELMDRYMRPIARLLLKGVYGYDTQTFGFTIQYHPELDTSLNPHTDASAATLNINLNMLGEEFEGSEVEFYDSETGGVNKVKFEAGTATLHRGSVPHATHPITSGKRTNLVVWLYGDRMQVPHSGPSAYGNFGGGAKVEVPETLDAKARWTVPNAPLDEYAPF